MAAVSVTRKRRAAKTRKPEREIIVFRKNGTKERYPLSTWRTYRVTKDGWKRIKRPAFLENV